ncbi:MAG: F0F1 ATP synthase subunit delta [Azospira oryzae]|uniref:ATP synthase subunit delta n=1 Tax=Pelomicrobium methylotrophicum TaxID=2602750 RepID=A0A5C7EY51_9PROT|nr:F0F1 ATP synthase subunit delta [Pelomicrobium methylotrophicum]PZP64553.1 MAG: F0F1 ATP synthase subunit delta [Azospira oryzae]PZP82516.1 MAG: F0F1 ATP synthase subunit delta [Azospira oryzae]TXF13257.1 F0F1 ATP synthase subunit delta [Pelomicrobium methylotrophicum]
MAEPITIARPYAEAVFKLASEERTLAQWSEMLALACAVAENPRVLALVGNPLVTRKQLGELFLGICGERLSGGARNFILVLIENGRLGLLPQIRELFEELRRQHEGVLEVEIESAYELDEAQRAALVQKLRAKYGREVSARVKVVPELIGGVRIHVGDEVMDASVRGKLDAMAAALAA